MPSPIPVVLDHTRFASQNQARLHFSEMLHRYQPGQTLTRSDAVELQSLLKRHPLHGKTLSADADRFRVEISHYGKPCFAAPRPDRSSQTVSYIQCIRHTPAEDDVAEPPVPSSTQKKKPSLQPSQAQGVADAPAPATPKPTKDPNRKAPKPSTVTPEAKP